MEIRRRRKLSVVTVLVVINALVFLIGSTGPQDWPAWDNVISTLTWSGLMKGHLWELFSYQFLHWNILHLAFNMMALWFAGHVLEEELGVPKFLLLYFASGVAGGLVEVIISPGSQVLGASASICGVLAGFSAMYPEVIVTALIFFVLPLKIRAKWIGVGIVVLSLVFILTGLFPGIGHAAHLGGAVTGAVMAWMFRRGRPPLMEPSTPDPELP